MSVIPTAFNQGLGYIPVTLENCSNNSEGTVTYTDAPDYELQHDVSGTPTTITRLNVDNFTTESVTLTTGVINNHFQNSYLRLLGQYTTNLDFNIALWFNGHVRYQASEFGGGHRFYIKDTTNNTVIEQIFQIAPGEIVASRPIRMEGNNQIQFPTGKVWNPSNNAYLGIRGDNTVIPYNIACNIDGSMSYIAVDTPGHQFFVHDTASGANVQKLALTGSSVQVYDTLVLNDSAQIQTDNDLTFNELNSGVQGTKGVISWTNFGQVLGYRSPSTLEPYLRIVNKLAQQAGEPYNIQLEENAVRINTDNNSDAGEITFEVEQQTVAAIVNAGLVVQSNKEIYYKGQTLDQRFTAQSFALPIGYTTVFSTRPSDQDNGYPGWRMFNASVFGGNPNGRVFGFDNEVEWPLKASSNAEPTISEYGANVTNTSGVKSAINFQINTNTSTTYSRYFGLSNNAYAGWWNIRVSLAYQNTSSSTNNVPMIRLRTGLLPVNSGPAATTELPQTSRGMGVCIHGITDLIAEGPVYLGSTATKVYISTLFEKGTMSTPPAWNDQALESEHWGNSINISCTFLGNTGINNETVTVLP